MKNHSLLDQILGPGGLRSLYQPIVELGSDVETLHALECLSRGPRGTNLEGAPLLFDYARLKGEASRVDRACINTALHGAGNIPFAPCLSLNAHATTLTTDPSFPTFLVDAAQEYGIPSSRLILEIVEHSPALSFENLRRAVEQLRQLGVRIALDDIGQGYSNYQMILECRPDYFKIDRFLVTQCHRHPGRRALLESILYLAERLGAQVVAEGVEDFAELQTLQNLGLHLFQGYYFARPMPSEQLVEHPVMTRIFGKLAPPPTAVHAV